LRKAELIHWAGAPQFRVHLTGIVNLSLIFSRKAGYIVSAPPKRVISNDARWGIRVGSKPETEEAY